MITTTKRRRPAPTALAALLLSSLASAAQTFPYVPTTVLLSPAAFPGGPSGRSESVAYIFHPTSSSVELLALNVSGTVSAGALQTITSSVPFLENASATTAFLPAVADDGSIIVQAGDCAVDNGYDVWTYTSGGEWSKTAATLPGDADSDAGPYALGAGISFSATLAPSMSKPVLYSFGGMCLAPTTNESWQENGTYTKAMLRVAPDGDAAYSASFVSGKGPAFPEAGFSFTPLSPSVSNRSGVVTQQSRYVLLGGHTRQAFINMSSAAIWNLPEESWSFATVGAPQAGSSSNELAIKRRSAENVESRSGHTAVLSEDGSALVVLGGWVGGVAQPASPQLAVLRMGDTYGDWAWEVPPEQPEAGVYGHGATMLPGNVMMVYGGYEISASGGGKRTKRTVGGTGLRFLNMTSMAWTTSYASPSSGESPAAEDAGTDMKKVGLGVGLGVGAAAVLGAVLVYLCYKRHLKRRKHARDETVRALAQDASHFLQPEDDMLERRDGGSYPWSSHAWYTGGDDPYDTVSRSLGYESLRNSHGAYQQQPPGLLIPRKPIPRAARGAYQPAANLTTPGHIHPIYEADEDDPDSARARYQQDEPATTPTTPGYPADPFATPTSAAAPVLLPLPPRGSATPSPEASRRDPEVQDWQSDVDAAEALLAQMPVRRASSRNTARRSPSRRASMRSRASMADDERTASNLSESGRSVISIPTRSASARRDPGLSIVTEARVGTSSSSGSSSHTYSTAKTTFNALQAEGPSLLHRGQRPLGEDEEEEDVPSSPSKHKPRRSLGWLGSLRRVFSVSPNDSSDSSGREDGNSARRVSLKDEPADDYEPRLGLSGIGGAELLRRKQGRRDWDADQRSVDEWDIEKAVEQRLVQVMFTVPKERLRVVNAEIEREEEVVLVDPDQDEIEEDEKRALVFDEKGKGKAVLLDEEDITTARYRPESPESPRGRRMVHLPPPKDDDDEDRGSLLLRPGTRDESEPRPSLTLRTAEVVSVARPRTRVLEMVENIERSRESSPSL
ncbi:hypothetical protein CMUS01_06536 [Colletotrichum musicola]|uniref:Galactose oxidase n=1 Tax=Colletotrichum musicola TaxID=2175873 RepID=A0A8H6KL55_9PEZI|nr:hypothetical protein CMUS01_06536 [Colletotrichum musicola]